MGNRTVDSVFIPVESRGRYEQEVRERGRLASRYALRNGIPSSGHRGWVCRIPLAFSPKQFFFFTMNSTGKSHPVTGTRLDYIIFLSQ